MHIDEVLSDDQINHLAAGIQLQSGRLNTRPWQFHKKCQNGFVYLRGHERVSISPDQVVQAWAGGIIRVPAVKPGGVPRLFAAFR